jgi:proton-translocating NADH-quinone oxidoreductase chain M
MPSPIFFESLILLVILFMVCMTPPIQYTLNLIFTISASIRTSVINYITIHYEIYKRTKLKTNLFIVSLVLFVATLFLLLIYDPLLNIFQYTFCIKYFNYYSYFGIDGITLFFLLLTSFFIPLCILFSWNSSFIYIKEYYICIISLEILLYIIFTTLDIFFFYIFFEAILIPFFILIGIYGSRVRKIHAAYMLFFYTIVGSILMLFSIIYIFIHAGTLNLQLLWNIEFDTVLSNFLWFSFFLSFSVKIPIFPFHIWLPEAHVEAPTEASVILAAILLKVGIYGFLRILIPVFPNITFYYLNIIILLNILSLLYTSLVTLRQIDIKKIIAYSSISHMNICTLGIISFKSYSISGSMLLMFGHGFVSGGLFFLIGILYDRYKTKVIFYYSGLVHSMPLFSSILFFYILSNISMPLTSNFIGEFLIIYGLLAQQRVITLLFVSISIFICTVYSILLYNKLIFGLPNYNNINYIKDIQKLEFMILLPITLCVLIIGIYPKLFIDIFIFNIYYYFNFLVF